MPAQSDGAVHGRPGVVVSRILPLLLLVGCAPYDFSPHPNVYPLPRGSVAYSAGELNAAHVAQWVDVVRARLTDSGVAGAPAAEGVTSGMLLVVDDRLFWSAPTGSGLSNGDYDPGPDVIHVSRDGSGLLHETLHRLDHQLGRYTPEHAGWEKLGYWSALRDWEAQAWPALTAVAMEGT